MYVCMYVYVCVCLQSLVADQRIVSHVVTQSGPKREVLNATATKTGHATPVLAVTVTVITGSSRRQKKQRIKMRARDLSYQSGRRRQ